MTKLRTAVCSLAIAAALGSGACLAQQHGVNLGAAGVPVPPTTLAKRCLALGQFVQQASAARDAGESENHFIGRLGLNMSPPEGLGLIHRRLDKNAWAPQESLGLVHMVFATTASPTEWQQQMVGACDRQLTQL